MFFLAGLRQVHNAYHYALGIPRAATEWVMAVLSVLMLYRGSPNGWIVSRRSYGR